MQDIKFRAWVQIPDGFDTKPGRVEAVFFTLEDVVQDRLPSLIKHTYTTLLSVDRYTSLKDKNDVEIYEGDIVASSSGYGPITFTNYGYVIERGKWPDQKGQATMPLAIPHETEVIGNIHQNPELLEAPK